MRIPLDFADSLEEIGMDFKHVKYLGYYQMNHFWMLYVGTEEVKELLLAAGGPVFKGKRCLGFDPSIDFVQMKFQWVPHRDIVLDGHCGLWKIW